MDSAGKKITRAGQNVKILLGAVGRNARILFANWPIVAVGKKIRKEIRFLLTIWSNDHIL
jgi:hypothetical protein